MIALLWAAAAAAAVQFAFVCWNKRQLPLLPDKEAAHTVTGASSPYKLSVLIPARNEERRLGGCLASILEQTDSSSLLEVLVLDDGSVDGTAALTACYAKDDPRVRLLAGKPLPEGWAGKCHACMQLGERAKGDWLLFLDADARLEPGALRRIILAADQQGSGMVTGFPVQKTGTWLEKLVVPLMMFTVLCHLPIPLVRGSRRPSFAAAHGGFILISADAYHALGGHTAVKSEIVEDMALIRAVKRTGYQAAFVDLRGVVKMRMYESAVEVWEGYRKNIYAGLGRSTGLLMAVMMLYIFLYILPSAAVIASLWAPALLLPAGIAYMLGILIKLQSDRLMMQPVWLALLLPVSIAALLAIAFSSWRASVSRKGYTWKGRVYR